MNKRQYIKSGGASTLSLLGIAFIILKLCAVIDWSWWWVTCPFWGIFSLILAGVVLLGFLCLIHTLVGNVVTSIRGLAGRKGEK